MDWLALALALVKAVGTFVGWLHEKAMIDAGQAQQVATELKAQSDALAKALAAREAVRADLARNPAGMRNSDGFRRD